MKPIFTGILSLCKAEGYYGTMGRVCQPVYRGPRSIGGFAEDNLPEVVIACPVSVVQATLTFFTCHLPV